MFILNLSVFITTILAGCSLIASDGGSFTTRMTAVKCFKNDEFISNIICKLKPVRGGIGVLSTSVVSKKPLNDLWMQSKLFYKFGTIYREWLMKYDIDICDAISGRPPINIMESLFVSYWKQFVTKDKCPLQKVFNVTMNADNQTSNLSFERIPRLPEGDYKNIHRFHTRENVTIYMYEIKFTIKSKVGVNRTSMLDMG